MFDCLRVACFETRTPCSCDRRGGGTGTRIEAAQVGVATEIWLALQGENCGMVGTGGARNTFAVEPLGANPSLTAEQGVRIQKTLPLGRPGPFESWC